MPKRMTRDEFIERSRRIHNDKYNYSLVEYINIRTKVIIICPNHGRFRQTPDNHLEGKGCNLCGYERFAKNQTYTQADFLAKSRQCHGDRYDYSKSIYHSAKEKVIIICLDHGEFEQAPITHYRGTDCPKCARARVGKNQTHNTEIFVKRAKKIHNNKYDYSKTKYKRAIKKVIIICPVHGEFLQKPSEHLNGYGCARCHFDSLTLTLDEVLTRCKEIHNGFYDYSNITEYNTLNDRALIICPIHGEFEQRIGGHISGAGCWQCKVENQMYTTEEFIAKSKIKHRNRYDYSRVEYNGAFEQVTIICPQHGEFEQAAHVHLGGSGCPICKSSKGERRIVKILDKMGIGYTRQKKFEGCRGTKNQLPFDFFFRLNGTVFLIEYDGKHHFEMPEIWGGEKALKIVQERDRIKTEFAKQKGFVLIRIPYTIKNIEKFLNREIERILVS